MSTLRTTTVRNLAGTGTADTNQLGQGQTYQLVTRVSGTTYTNSTGRPILLCVKRTNASGSISTTIGGLVILNNNLATSAINNITETAIVPDGVSYVITANAGATFEVYELRT